MTQRKLKTPNELMFLLTHSDVTIREKAYEFFAKNLLMNSIPNLSLENFGLGFDNDVMKNVASFHKTLTEQAVFLNQRKSWQRFYAIIDKAISAKIPARSILSMLQPVVASPLGLQQICNILPRIKNIGSIEGDLCALKILYEMAEKSMVLYPLVDSVVATLPKKDLLECAEEDLFSVFDGFNLNHQKSYFLLLEYLASCPNNTNDHNLFAVLQKNKFQTNNDELFKSAIRNLNGNKLSYNDVEMILNFIQFHNNQLSANTQYEVLLWLLEKLPSDNSRLADCMSKLIDIVKFDVAKINSIIPHLHNMLHSTNKINNVFAIMNAVFLLKERIKTRMTKKDSVICRRLLKTIMVKEAFRELKAVQIKIILHTLWSVQQVNDEALQKEGTRSMRFFLKNYNFYEYPTEPIFWAVEHENDNLWENVQKQVPLQKYQCRSRIVEDILSFKNEFATSLRAKERLHKLLKVFLENKVLLGYDDYRNVQNLLKENNLQNEITPRMSRAGKEKQKILLSLNF